MSTGDFTPGWKAGAKNAGAARRSCITPPLQQKGPFSSTENDPFFPSLYFASSAYSGASAVAVGTACFDDPYAPIKVRDGLASLAERQGLNKVSDFTGAVVPW